MHRRSFLSLSALSAVPVVARAAEDAPEPDWHETITSDVMKFRGFDLTREGKAMKIPERFQNASFSRFPVTQRPHRRSLPLPTAHRSLLTRHFFRSSANPASSSDTDTARRMSAETTTPDVNPRGLPQFIPNHGSYA